MPQTSRTPRTPTDDPTGAALTHLSVRELLQRLAACEEALRTPLPGEQPPAERQALLRDEAAISGELQRRRHLRHPRQRAAGRRPSAAWPPPPW